MLDSVSEPSIRLLVILEGTTVTGPAKNVLEFCRVSRSLNAQPVITTSVSTFVRAEEHAPKFGTRSNDLLEAASAAGVDVHSIPERFPFDPQVIGHLREQVNQLDPDIIQTHHVKSHFLVRLSGVWRTHHWIAFHHGYTDEGIRMWLYDQLDRWSLRVPSQVVTVCQPFKQNLSARGVSSSRIVVLHNAISLNWLSRNKKIDDALVPMADSTSTSRCEQERVVLAVGRLSAEKAFSDLVVAMDHLRRLRPDLFVRLVIIGEGFEKGRIERAVHDLNLQERVTLAGHVRDVRPYYRMADVLAISSVSEGSPNALLEAMAAGVPVVATSVGGIPEIVADTKTALLVEPRNPVAMASAINRLFSNSDLARALVCDARELIEKQYSTQSRARFLIGFYEQVCRSKTPSKSIRELRSFQQPTP